MRRTKIVCTLGPNTCDEESIFLMTQSGMNVCRLNFSHGSHESHKRVIEAIFKVRKRVLTPLAILMDTKGPEIRLGPIVGEYKVVVGQQCKLVAKSLNDSDLEIFPPSIIGDLEVGLDLYIDDGKIHSKVVKTSDDSIYIEILNSGVITSNKSINIPRGKVNLPLITQKDVDDITFAVNSGADFIAASFVCHQDQVYAIRDLLKKLDKSDVRIISKIESQSGLDNFDSILDASDGIMVARGDLGVEVAISSIPRLQKKMILQANLKGKISITATQMLESMVENPYPLRAEVSDVANSIYDATSAVMLSGETAIGKHPLKVIEMMDEIIQDAQEDFDHDRHFLLMEKSSFKDVSSAIALSSVKVCHHTTAKAIVVATSSGSTAIAISRFHPKNPIIAVTPNERSFHQMALVCGVVAMREKYQDMAKGFDYISCFCLQMGWVDYGDLVVLTSGEPFGKSYTTNSLIVDSIGDVLLRAKSLVKGDSVKADLLFYLSDRVSQKNMEGKIVLIQSVTGKLLQYLKGALAVIYENRTKDRTSINLLKNFCQKHGITAIFEASGASTLLSEGDTVIVDSNIGLVFSKNTISRQEMLAFK